MANEYVEVALLKTQLKITDADRDDLLNAALEAASRGIDAYTGRRFYMDASASQRLLSWRGRVTHDSDGEHLLVSDIASATDLVVEVGRDPSWTDITDEVELEPTDAFERGKPVTSLLYENRFFSSHRRVRVTAIWGWPAVPAEVEEATLIQASRLYKRKDSPEGVVGSAEWGAIRVGRIDPDVQTLVQHLILPGVA